MNTVEVDGLVYGPHMVRALRAERDELAARLTALSPSPQGVTEEQVEALRIALKRWDGYDPEISQTQIVAQANALADASRRVLEQFAATPAPAQGEWVMDIPVEKYRTDEQRA
ncbi:MAG: hypothetical protein K0S56_574, partial [Microvirga sp.]|nr:hypothetical protein [Microvirga sp.]